MAYDAGAFMFLNNAESVRCGPIRRHKVEQQRDAVGVGHETVYSQISYQQALSLCRNVHT